MRFRDRDDLTPEEIEFKRAEGVRIMSAYRNIESMLLSDGVLKRLCDGLGKSDRFDPIRTARDDALTRPGLRRAADDLKPAAQAVHHAARRELELPRERLPHGCLEVSWRLKYSNATGVRLVVTTSRYFWRTSPRTSCASCKIRLTKPFAS